MRLWSFAFVICANVATSTSRTKRDAENETFVEPDPADYAEFYDDSFNDPETFNDPTMDGLESFYEAPLFAPISPNDIIRGKLMKVIPSFPSSWELTFDVLMKKQTSWGNVLWLTTSSTSSTSSNGGGLLRIYTTSDSVPKLYHYTYPHSTQSGATTGSGYSAAFTVNSWVSVKIVMTSSGYYYFYINGKNIYNKRVYTKAWTNVRIYASAPWYHPADGQLKNLKLTSGGKQLFSAFLSDSTPCPSSECWTYSNEQCTPKATCVSVSCSATAMTVSYSKALGVTPKGKTPSTGGKGLTVVCPLGQCAMTHKVESNSLKFTMTMDSGEGVSLQVGASNIYTGAGYSASFQCTYPVDVEVTSSKYTVKPGASPASPFVSSGSLASRFKVTLAGAEKTMSIGARVSATVTWDSTLAGLSGVSMYLNECSVKTGSMTVKVLTGGCYSKSLGVKPGKPTSTSQALSYKVFTALTGKEESQDLTCKIRICMSTCKKPTKDSDCLASGNYAIYKYTIAGDV
jgi:hypothetical protein